MNCNQPSNTTRLIEVVDHFQTENNYVLLVLKTSQVPMYPDVNTNPPICSALCHLQIRLQHQLQEVVRVNIG